jgi:hypothetical protein
MARLALCQKERGDGGVGYGLAQPLLGLVCLVDCVAFIDLVLSDRRKRRATRNNPYAADGT